MKNRKLSATIALMMLISSVTACGGSGTGASETTAAPLSSDTTTAASAPEYEYPQADYEGYEFKFLNIEKQGWANVTIAPTETTGDLISDAQFERNARIEERYNVSIKEYSETMANVQTQLIQNVTAGDDAFDSYVIALHLASAVMTEGYLVDLNTVDKLNLDKPWWDQNVNHALELDGKLMLTTSDISFFPFEATWAIFFNEDDFDDLGLAYPYDTVRQGKWTIDKLTEIAKAGASLNGDESFETFDENGSSRYGLGSHTFILSLIRGAGEAYVRLDGDNVVFNADSEKMFSIYEKMAALASPSIGAYYDNSEKLFEKYEAGRLMMYCETLGHLAKMRNLKSNFGVLPLPKYDEAQEEYYSLIAQWGTGMTTIPTSATNIDRTAIILDALAYDSYVNLMDPYYDTYLTQKGLRNEDSAEMLSIIRATRAPASDVAFGWASTLNSNINSKLKVGDGDIASIIASNKTVVTENVNKTFDAISK